MIMQEHRWRRGASPAAQALISFTRSPAGQNPLRTTGQRPLNP
jgi:hypothetical protein